MQNKKLQTPAPLYEDPIWGGPSDPVVLWNPFEKCWWMLYTQRHAFGLNIGVSSIHGTDIGTASSGDAKLWTYRGVQRGLEIGRGRDTYWAPDVIYEPKSRLFHMYVSYIEGVPCGWTGSARIAHFTSENLWDWTYVDLLPLDSDRVIDACVKETAPGRYKLWYKDERRNSHTVSAESTDLYHWYHLQEEITDCPHEGPCVFEFSGRKWMLTDTWNGLAVYFSDDYTHWTRQNGKLLDRPGSRPLDGEIGNHASVYAGGGRAFIFYFVHPDFPGKLREDPTHGMTWREAHTVVQAAELFVRDGKLVCDRDSDFDISGMRADYAD